MSRAILASLAFLFIRLTDTQASEPNLDVIREGARHSREAIHTLHAVYETVQQDDLMVPQGHPKKPIVTKVEWWQDGAKIRWKEESRHPVDRMSLRPQVRGKITDQELVSITTRDGCISNGEMTTILRSRFPNSQWKTNTDIRPYKPDEFVPNDVWVQSLFVLIPRPRLTVHDLLAIADNVKEIKTAEESGHKYYAIKATAPPPHQDYELNILVDPKRNWVVKKSVPMTASPKEMLRFESEVTSFREHGSGIYFPDVVVTRTYAISKPAEKRLLSTRRTKFVSVSVNQPIDPSVFERAIPPGTPVVDHRDETIYMMGSNGAPKGEVVPAPSPSPVVAQQPSYSREEKPRYLLMALGILGLVLLVGLAVAHRRFRRERRVKH